MAEGVYVSQYHHDAIRDPLPNGGVGVIVQGSGVGGGGGGGGGFDPGGGGDGALHFPLQQVAGGLQSVQQLAAQQPPLNSKQHLCVQHASGWSVDSNSSDSVGGIDAVATNTKLHTNATTVTWLLISMTM